MARLRIAIRYDPRRIASEPPAAGSTAEGHGAFLSLAVGADELGIDVVWVAERPTEPDAMVPAALPLCAALAAGTRRIRIGTAVLPLPLYHPLRVAEDAASLDGISGGRFELGVGLGADPQGFHGFGVEAAQRSGRLEEAVALIRRGWADDPVDFDGRYFSLSGVDVVPKPVQKPGPPLWIGAGAEDAQRRAARVADGLILAPGASPDAFLEAWSAAGRQASDTRVAVPVPVAAASLLDPGAAIEGAGRALATASGAGAVDLVFPAPPPSLSPAQGREFLELLAVRVRAEFLGPRTDADLGAC